MISPGTHACHLSRRKSSHHQHPHSKQSPNHLLLAHRSQEQACLLSPGDCKVRNSQVCVGLLQLSRFETATQGTSPHSEKEVTPGWHSHAHEEKLGTLYPLDCFLCTKLNPTWTRQEARRYFHRATEIGNSWESQSFLSSGQTKQPNPHIALRC